jgi:predicted transposase/invertase (TIGR01784 family)
MSNEAKNINLLTDFGFKRFFGTEPYKKNLIHFLNAFLPPYIGTVTDVTFRPTEQLGMTDKNKRIVFDVFCSNQNESKENIVVEMQKASQEFLKNRVIAYSSRIISNSLKKGDRKYNYPTVISIILANFKIPELKGSSDFVQHVMLKDDKNRVFSEKVSFLLIDLSKFAARKQ